MSADYQMRVVVPDAAGVDKVPALRNCLPQPRYECEPLARVEAHRGVLQRRLRRAAKGDIVRVVGERALLGRLGRGTKLVEFPGADEVGPGAPRVVRATRIRTR